MFIKIKIKLKKIKDKFKRIICNIFHIKVCSCSDGK
jgi:hypothetical protein